MNLLVFQAMWGMQNLPWRSESKWSFDEQIELLVEAGFDGISISLDDPQHVDVIAAMERHGLAFCLSAFPTNADELQPYIDKATAFGAHHLNVQPNVRPLTLEEALPTVRAWQERAAAATIPVRFETHRDRMTTDLFFTLNLIDAVPELRLTADLSHFLVGREFRYPVDEVNQGLMARIIERSDGFHGRVASREQVQISFGFPQNRHWLELFLDWWRAGFEGWCARAAPGDSCAFVVELGPPEYAITGPDGHELDDRWREATEMMGLVRGLWAEVAPGVAVP